MQLASEQTQHLIVFDLEWNQSSYNPNHRMPHEIIEIGACRVNRDYQVVDTFSRTIRPRLYKKLDKHIKSVTGITEAELAEGGEFADVFGAFIAWCADDALLVTWGRDDFPVLRRNAQFFQTPMPFSPPVDAQLVFGHACLKTIHQQMNLHNALETMEIEIDGGVSAENVALVKQAGANVIVAGSAIFKASDQKAAIEELKTK